jgi:hypothetical protein
MIRELRIRWYSYKLQKLIDARRRSFEVQDYAKRRAAALKGRTARA